MKVLSLVAASAALVVLTTSAVFAQDTMMHGKMMHGKMMHGKMMH